MNNLLIDVTFVVNELKRKRPPHGIPRVILAYLRHYQNRIQLVYRIRQNIFLIPKRYSQKIISLLLQWEHSLYKDILLLLIKGVMVADKINKQEQYVLLKIDQNGMKYPKYFTQLNAKGIKTIVMFHDLFPIFYPEYSDPNYALQFENNIKSSIKNATGLICVSQNTRDTVTQYVATQNLACPPTITASLAPGLVPTATPKARPIEAPYFVIISTIVARKNHLLLLHIWRQLVKEFGDQAPKLVIIGKRSTECTSTLSMLDRCLQVRQHIIEFTATDQELQNYLVHAAALLFPTFAEGYGLPLIEALAANVPVLSSDLPIFREIAADIPEYLDPLDGTGWKQMIIEYAQANSARREAQLQRLAQFKIPIWEEHFNIVDAFLKQL